MKNEIMKCDICKKRIGDRLKDVFGYNRLKLYIGEQRRPFIDDFFCEEEMREKLDSFIKFQLFEEYEGAEICLSCLKKKYDDLKKGALENIPLLFESRRWLFNTLCNCDFSEYEKYKNALPESITSVLDDVIKHKEQTSEE